jgi:hypothetical protein
MFGIPDDFGDDLDGFAHGIMQWCVCGLLRGKRAKLPQPFLGAAAGRSCDASFIAFSGFFNQ